ncbi:Shedu anti-phage system protein SduA domain-containing protein [Maribacter thermophilus]|uniref:Shedu anti-phage system protein SduA domain-containing protein n=1 Tax=Maribacter thermophilus TaxID=1197874 RepID=UPI0006412316|nr:Shedu anti-phage system protein SduA domain-containing protein [Maribacter thermophilus]
MTYEFTKNAPKTLSNEEYISKAEKEFQYLLHNSSHDETTFQKFFERNPCFMPGARDEFSILGQSGHNPHLNCLITQPQITGLIKRVPDFMWLANDSVYFSPIIIEIEAPSKKYFKKDGNPTSHFSQARNQLEEWQTILKRPENILSFYRDFSIPQDLTSLTFKPRFVLIYGRREEFTNDRILTQKRGSLFDNDKILMSYDRIKPKLFNNYVTCKVKNGKYFAKYLNPTFKIGPFADEILELQNLIQAVDNTSYLTDQRKAFLKDKIPYCLEYFKVEKNGKTVKIKNNGTNYQTEE